MLALVIALLAAVASPAAAAFVTFESGQVRPLALTPDGTRLLAVNTPDGRLEVFDVDADGLHHRGSVAVGLEPVAVAARTNDEAWVVNHLSDSVSVVTLDGPAPRVVRTLLVGDEPRDIVFAGPERERAFVTTAHRGQHRPGGADLTTPGVGRADVWVFDAAAPDDTALGGTPLDVLTLFGDTPRALAATPDGATVYVAVFHSGNQTTTVSEALVCDGGPSAPPCNVNGRSIPGGLPGPRTNAAGVPGPETGLIVRFDPAAGHWYDPLGRVWDEAIGFELPDEDVFRIDAATLETTGTFAHVGTTLFGMAVNPVSGAVYVSNTEARNETRFEGPGTTGGSTVRGHLHEARVTILDGDTVVPRHVNPHIDYAVVPSPPGVAERSLAQPLGMAVSPDGATLWVAAFGSGVVGIIDTAALAAGSFTPDPADHIALSGGGPTGVVHDATHDRLYVLTRFDNAVSVLDPAARQEIAHHPLHNPEPASVRDGRRFLYDARATSSNGEASCASCHVFGDMDQLAWDLGNPDGEVVPNRNPLHIGIATPFHPLKGPMTTQTLRGMARHGPMHWRGDRTGGSVEGGDPLDETQAFMAFLGAFESLLGRDGPILEEDMARFAAFALSITSPPNPVRALDGSLTPEQNAGRELYFGRVTDLDDDCVGCHVLAPRDGLFGTDGLTALQGDRVQLFKIPHLRNMYQKVGMFSAPIGSSGPQIRGFGFTHDGSTDTIFRFLQESQFRLNDVERRLLEQFLFVFDAELAPVVGQQVTLRASNAAAAAPHVDLLAARAAEHECDLVAHGVVDGEARGWLRRADGSFLSDRLAEPPLALDALKAQAAMAGQEVTFTCVPLGAGARHAVDRDEDGYLDRDELDAGSDPADRNDTPGGPPLTLGQTLVRTTALRLTAAKKAPVTARLRFTARTPKDDAANRIVPPPRGSALDPTAHGATLVLANAQFTDDLAVRVLPAAGWRAVGSEDRPKGYRFRSKDVGPGEPPASVLLKRDTLRVRGDFAYSLNEPAQGRVAVRLVPGAVFDDAGWCAAAPARPQGPLGSTVKSDRPGRFLAAKRTPPPATCPPPP
ncbi:MAG TPA: YncE family protein [Candidatus Limnocylindria bacterium]|nr:YncE family protein [Candidatus Limnocylindria bacterium]